MKPAPPFIKSVPPWPVSVEYSKLVEMFIRHGYTWEARPQPDGRIYYEMVPPRSPWRRLWNWVLWNWLVWR